jgi:uncharacterized protein (TIGR00297 family)
MFFLATIFTQIHSPWAAALLTLAFAVLAHWLRGVSTSGAIAGWIVSFMLYAAAGPGAFATLVLVFILTWAATRFGYQRKQRLGTAEKKEGRTASQVLANVGLAAVCAAAYRLSQGNVIFLLALSSALAEATADTVSSELGQASSETARLITTWKQVPAGTDGGITLIGTLGGIVAATLVSLAAVFTGSLPWKWLPISIGTAVTAMLADSFMGALLERRGWLNNDAVNSLSTALAAAMATMFAA